MLKGFPQAVLSLALTGLAAQGQENDGSSVSEPLGSEPIYLFLGGELSARQGNGTYPVLTMTKRHIVVDKGISSKRVRKDSPVLMRLKPRVSYSMVSVNQFDFSFSSTLPAAVEARAMSEMMRHQWGTDTEIAILPSLPTQGGRRRADYDRIEELNRENAEFQEDIEDEARDRAFEVEDIVDTLHLELGLLPERDYEDAYIAVAVGEAGQGAETEVGGDSQVVMGYLGTLRSGQVETFKLRLKLRPFRADDALCELFLFCEDGKPIATDLSRSLKKMTRQQLADLVSSPN